MGKIPYTQARDDDILVSGKYDEEHMANVKSVLRTLKESGLTVRPSNVNS